MSINNIDVSVQLCMLTFIEIDIHMMSVCTVLTKAVMICCERKKNSKVKCARAGDYVFGINRKYVSVDLWQGISEKRHNQLRSLF